MRRGNDDADEMIGQDSFLDVVTNIVGILILLVMVVGMRASHAVEIAADSRSQRESAPAITQHSVREAYQSAQQTEREVRGAIHRAVSTGRETLLRERERELLHTVVTEVEQEIAARRSKLSVHDQRDFDIRRQLNEAQLKLDELTREQVALLSQAPEVEEIECAPTPVASVVTGKQAHLLLADDHVAIVPFDELLEQMAEDAKANTWRLQREDKLIRTVGPVNGFRLRYYYVKSEVVARSEAGTVVAGNVFQVSHCHFLPQVTPIGEPAAEALLENSELQMYLRRLDVKGITITVWAYPGNYDRLRDVKRMLRGMGFQTAVRPLPHGVPIGASRFGSESLAE